MDQPPDRRRNDEWKSYFENYQRKFIRKLVAAFAVLGVLCGVALYGQSHVSDDIQQERFDNLLRMCKAQNERHDNAIDRANRLLDPQSRRVVKLIVDELQPYVDDCVADAASRVKGKP